MMNSFTNIFPQEKPGDREDDHSRELQAGVRESRHRPAEAEGEAGPVRLHASLPPSYRPAFI